MESAVAEEQGEMVALVMRNREETAELVEQTFLVH
jgi:hypothetical protein